MKNTIAFAAQYIVASNRQASAVAAAPRGLYLAAYRTDCTNCAACGVRWTVWETAVSLTESGRPDYSKVIRQKQFRRFLPPSSGPFFGGCQTAALSFLAFDPASRRDGRQVGCFDLFAANAMESASRTDV